MVTGMVHLRQFQQSLYASRGQLFPQLRRTAIDPLALSYLQGAGTPRKIIGAPEGFRPPGSAFACLVQLSYGRATTNSGMSVILALIELAIKIKQCASTLSMALRAASSS